MYHGVLYGLLGGALVPIPFWYLGRKYPNSFWKVVNWGVILNSVTAIPPANGVNYACFLLVGFIFRTCRCFPRLQMMILITRVYVS